MTDDEAEETDDDYLRVRDVVKRTGLSKSEIYRRIALGQFPRSRRLGYRTAAWTVGQIKAWKAALDDADDERLKELL